MRRFESWYRPRHQMPSVIGNKQLPSRKLVKPMIHVRFMARRAEKSAARTIPLPPQTRHRSQSAAAASPTSVTLVMIRSATHAGSQETSPARTMCPIQFGIGFHEIV